MKKLENKGFDSKREMEILDALEEVKQINKRKQGFNPDRLLLELFADKEIKEEVDDKEFDKLKEKVEEFDEEAIMLEI